MKPGGRGKSERYKRGVQRKSFDSAELFNLKTGISELLPATMTQPRTYHCAVTLRDGNVLIAGGYTPDLPYQDDYTRHDKSAELFDPKTRTFKPVNPMNVPRSNPGAALRAAAVPGRLSGRRRTRRTSDRSWSTIIDPLSL